MAEDEEELDASAFAATAGFDFDVVEYEQVHEVSSDLLKGQLRDLLRWRTEHACSPCSSMHDSTLHTMHAAKDGGAFLRVYDETKRCTLLVVAFAALAGSAHRGGENVVAKYEFVGACQRSGCSHALFAKDVRESWYLFGLDDGTSPPSDFAAVVRAIEAELQALQPKRVLMVGASMGGYAAIRSALTLSEKMGRSAAAGAPCAFHGAISVLVFAPQIFIEPEERAQLKLSPMAFDSDLRRAKERWRAESADPSQLLLPSAADLLLEAFKTGGQLIDHDVARAGADRPSLASTGCPSCDIHVHVGSLAAGDVREAMLLREASRVTGKADCNVHIHRRLGHLLVRDLRESGLLDEILGRYVTESEGSED